MTTLAGRLRSVLVSAPETIRLGPIRRSTSLFSQDQPAEAAFFIEDGLVKLTRTGETGDRIISSVYGPGQMLGEEVLSDAAHLHYALAETLTIASVYRVPRDTLRKTLASSPDLANAFIAYILDRNRDLEEKGELLCLYDVEHRILYYLAELAGLVKPIPDGTGYQLPLTQAELAELIGATRETTSTTLNHLERRGLVKLSRRLMTVPSPVVLMNAARDRLTYHNGAS